MANHAHIESDQDIRPDKVTEIFHTLNRTLFHNALKIEYSAEEGTWSSHQWMIYYIGASPLYKERPLRIFWLNEDGSFETRHGGGSLWVWWISNTIMNEIALNFNGKLFDDGVGDVEVDITYKTTFRCWLDRYAAYKTDDDYKRMFLEEELGAAPIEFR